MGIDPKIFKMFMLLRQWSIIADSTYLLRLGERCLMSATDRKPRERVGSSSARGPW